jgi:rRNA maturation protein Nop10
MNCLKCGKEFKEENYALMYPDGNYTLEFGGKCPECGTIHGFSKKVRGEFSIIEPIQKD